MMTTEQTLGEVVAASPAAARIFHRHHLDFCCGGQQSLTQACTASGIDPDALLREIAAAGSAEQTEVRWDQRRVEELVGHILDHYHAPLREELPRLIDLASRVEQVHAEKPECPKGLAALLVGVRDAVENHLGKEEGILFPLILSGRGGMARMPVQVMLQEHEDHGQSLRRIRALADDFQAPAEACASWRELYRSLEQLEFDLMEHIHLENNILFPRALAD